MLHRLAENAGKPRRRQPRALILAPSRELAGQIGDSLRSYSRHLRLRSAVVFGGTSIRPQIRALAHGVHVLVATPGRLIDLMNQSHLRLDATNAKPTSRQARCCPILQSGLPGLTPRFRPRWQRDPSVADPGR